MTTSLQDAVALVTGASGASGGIGRAICEALRDAGASVVATSRKATSSEGLAADLVLDLDVTDEAGWARVIEAVERRYKRLDILVNNAGISFIEKFEEMTLADWQRCQSINVDGTFLGIKAATRLLRESGSHRRGGSSVINLSSVGGLRGATYNVAYCTSKGAVRLLTKAVAIEFSYLKYPIRVNSVHPGGVDTDMIHSIIERYVDLGVLGSAEQGFKFSAAAHPIGRMGEADEIAAGVRFLASDEASFMQGAELVLDGGLTAK